MSLPRPRWPASEEASGRYAFHQIAVARDAIGKVVDDFLFFVVNGREMRFRECEADGVADTLTERTGRDLDARGVMHLRVSRRQTA